MNPPLIIFGAIFSLLFISLVMNLGHILKEMLRASRKTLMALLFIIMVGLLLRLESPSIIKYMDGYWLLGASHSIYQQGEPMLCYYTGYESISCMEYFKTIGVPFIFSFSFFGPGEYKYMVPIIFGAVNIVMMFVVSQLFFRRNDASLFSALVISIFPSFIMHSHSVTTDMVGLFFLLLSMLSLLLYQRLKRPSAYVFLVLSLAVSLHMRLELAAISLMIFLYLLYKSHGNVKWKSPYFIFPIIMFLTSLALSIPQYMRYMDVFSKTTILRLNIIEVYLTYSQSFAEPLLLYALAVPGIFFLARRKTFMPIFLALFFGSIMVFSLRHLLPFYLSITVLATAGFIFVTERAQKQKNRILVYALLVFLPLISFYPFVPPYYSGFNQKALLNPLSSLETAAFESIGNDVPQSCYVMYMYPNLFMTQPFPNTILIPDEKEALVIINNTGCLMLYDGIGCMPDEASRCIITEAVMWECDDSVVYGGSYNEECRENLNNYETAVFREYVGKGFSFRLYNLSIKT